jgi:hypothetical protein
MALGLLLGVARRDVLGLGASVCLRGCAPGLQRQQQARRLAVFVLRPRHVAHAGQKTRAARVVSGLDRRLQVHTLGLRRRPPLGVQATAGALAFSALPSLGFWHGVSCLRSPRRSCQPSSAL